MNEKYIKRIENDINEIDGIIKTKTKDIENIKKEIKDYKRTLAKLATTAVNLKVSTKDQNTDNKGG